MDRNGLAGFTLVELVIVLAVIAAVMTIATANLITWTDNQRAATSARSAADAFAFARAEAIRTGSHHIVAFDIEAGLDGIGSDIVVANDGAPNVANCEIDAGETVETIMLERGVAFGSDPSQANGTPAPDDGGGSGNQAAGSSFTDGATPTANASWVMFPPDGMPRLFKQDGITPCDDVSPVGAGGGAIYVTNGNRDYAVVLSALGTARLHRWNADAGAWTE